MWGNFSSALLTKLLEDGEDHPGGHGCKNSTGQEGPGTVDPKRLQVEQKSGIQRPGPRRESRPIPLTLATIIPVVIARACPDRAISSPLRPT